MKFPNLTFRHTIERDISLFFDKYMSNWQLKRLVWKLKEIRCKNKKQEDKIMTTVVRRHQNNWLPLFFNDFFKDDWRVGTTSSVPAINVKESENAYTVEVAAAGFTKDDFNVSLDDDNDLLITVEKKNEVKEDESNVRYLRRGFSYSKFQHTMTLPDDVNKDKIDAKVEHGVLQITLPKLKEEEIVKKQRQIAID